MAEVKNLYSIIRKRYPENEYALMEEVSDASGFNRSRSADYIAVGLWPSRGLYINGIELKSFRSDWLSELKKPKKAENIFQYCDFFWLLTTDDTIARIEEIPATWGWLCVSGGRIIIKKDAPKLTPVELTRHFICAMLKRAVSKNNFVHVDSIADKIEQAKESAIKNRTYQQANMEKALTDLRKEVMEFEEASGIKITHRWQGNTKIGEAVKFIENGGVNDIEQSLLRLKTQAENICIKINSALEIDTFKTPTPISPSSILQ